MRKTVTAESVTMGHPDKLADLIADNILDKCLTQDKNSRVACEILLCNKQVNIAGEIATNAKIDYIEVAKNVISKVGYDTKDLKFNVSVHQQSDDIEQAVFNKGEQGAGDQGIVYGYATKETRNFMPIVTNIAHNLTGFLEEARIKGKINGLLPDGKAQVSVDYENGIYKRINTIVISTQHIENINLENFKSSILYLLSSEFLSLNSKDTEILINPSGRFVIGGFEADTGLTGRKLAVDSYGGIAHNGGGALSGKDGSKVDRSGAYMARYVAKNLVAAGVADDCEISIAYAIGKSKPVAIDVSLGGEINVDEDLVKNYVIENFDFKPSSIIKNLRLKTPFFAETAVGGHFGYNHRTWEQTDKARQIQRALL